MPSLSILQRPAPQQTASIRCYHFACRGMLLTWGKENEESIPTGCGQRSDLPHRHAATFDATPVGENGCGAEDGALFRGARYGVRPAHFAARIHWPSVWPAGAANLFQRQTVFQK